MGQFEPDASAFPYATSMTVHGTGLTKRQLLAALFFATRDGMNPEKAVVDADMVLAIEAVTPTSERAIQVLMHHEETTS